MSKQTFFSIFSTMFFHNQFGTRYMWFNSWVKLKSIMINQLNQGKEGLGLVSRPDGQGFQTWF